MKKFAKVSAVLAAMVLALALFGACSDDNDDDDYVAVTAVTISGEKVVKVGETITLTATVLPANATNKKVVWSSGSDEIATVDADSGEVTGVKAGSVTITAKAGEISGTYEIKVASEIVKDVTELTNAISQENAVVVLEEDITISEALTLGKNAVLDGNGKTITGVAANVFAIGVPAEGATVQNLVLNDFGGSAETVSQMGVFKVPDGATGTFTAKNITLSNFNRAAFDIRGGNFLIEDCEIDCANQSTSKLTKGILIQNAEGTVRNVTIKNAKSTYNDSGNAWNTNAIETWENCKVEIVGCTLGTEGAEVKNGVSLNIGNGETTVTISDTKILAEERVVKTASSNSQTGTGKVELKSGTFANTTPNKPPLRINSGSYSKCEIVINQSGCTFTPALSTFEDYTTNVTDYDITGTVGGNGTLTFARPKATAATGQ